MKLNREKIRFGFIVVVISFVLLLRRLRHFYDSGAVQESVLDSGAFVSCSTLSNTSPLA